MAGKKNSKTEKKPKHHSIGKDHKHHAGVEGDYSPHHAIKHHRKR